MNESTAQFVIQSTYPPVINLDQLAELLSKSSSTISQDRVRSPQKLPPACSIPGSRRPLWLLVDVMEWIAQYREPQLPVPKKRGRPTKKEQVLKQKRQERGK